MVPGRTGRSYSRSYIIERGKDSRTPTNKQTNKVCLCGIAHFIHPPGGGAAQRWPREGSGASAQRKTSRQHPC